MPVADFAKAVEAAKMLDANNQERANYWGELGIWSTRRLGELLATMEKGKGGRPKKTGCVVQPVSLADIGIEKTAAHRAQKLAALPPEKVTAYVKRQAELGEEVSKAGLLRYAGAGETIATRHGNEKLAPVVGESSEYRLAGPPAPATIRARESPKTRDAPPFFGGFARNGMKAVTPGLAPSPPAPGAAMCGQLFLSGRTRNCCG